MLTVGPFSTSLYTALLAAGVLASMGWLLFRTPQSQRRAVADVSIGALLGGVILARGLHVALNWSHFSYHTDEIIRITAGGLDWHGGFWGAWIGLLIVSRMRRITVTPLYDRLALALSIIALTGWLGCSAVGCGYGIEVQTLADYPPLIAYEGPDIYEIYAPRINTYLMGVSISVIMLFFVVVTGWRGWFTGYRLWFALILFSLMMLIVGFVRGDYALELAGLRSDQWLDIGTAIAAIVIIWRLSRNKAAVTA